jgi:hypothetical protein
VYIRKRIISTRRIPLLCVRSSGPGQWGYANFVMTVSSEVRYELATPSNGKDSSFRGCALLSGGICCLLHAHIGVGVRSMLHPSTQ